MKILQYFCGVNRWITASLALHWLLPTVHTIQKEFFDFESTCHPCECSIWPMIDLDSLQAVLLAEWKCRCLFCWFCINFISSRINSLIPWKGVTWTYFWYISWSPILPHCNCSTTWCSQNIFSNVSSISWLKKIHNFISLSFLVFLSL